MSESELLAAQRDVMAAMARVRALENTADGQQLIDNLKFHQLV
jgi:hypothetical protein